MEVTTDLMCQLFLDISNLACRLAIVILFHFVTYHEKYQILVYTTQVNSAFHTL